MRKSTAKNYTVQILLQGRAGGNPILQEKLPKKDDELIDLIDKIQDKCSTEFTDIMHNFTKPEGRLIHYIFKVAPDIRPFLYPVSGRISCFACRISGQKKLFYMKDIRQIKLQQNIYQTLFNMQKIRVKQRSEM